MYDPTDKPPSAFALDEAVGVGTGDADDVEPGPGGAGVGAGGIKLAPAGPATAIAALVTGVRPGRNE
jgi:hypothetical protein